jgi:hypothetical protein
MAPLVEAARPEAVAPLPGICQSPSPKFVDPGVHDAVKSSTSVDAPTCSKYPVAYSLLLRTVSAFTY